MSKVDKKVLGIAALIVVGVYYWHQSSKRKPVISNSQAPMDTSHGVSYANAYTDSAPDICAQSLANFPVMVGLECWS